VVGCVIKCNMKRAGVSIEDAGDRIKLRLQIPKQLGKKTREKHITNRYKLMKRKLTIKNPKVFISYKFKLFMFNNKYLKKNM